MLPTKAALAEQGRTPGGGGPDPDRTNGSRGGTPSGGREDQAIVGSTAVKGRTGRVETVTEVDWGRLLDGSRVLELLYRLEVMSLDHGFGG